MVFMRDYWLFTFLMFSVLVGSDELLFSGKYRAQMWQEMKSEGRDVRISTHEFVARIFP